MLANLATALFEHGSITTTETRARRLRPFAERLITKAKRGDLAARRQVLRVIRDKDVVHVLFTDIAPGYAGRHGGYTRIVKLGPRKGDAAPMAVIALVEPLAEQAVAEAEGATRRAAKEQAAAPVASGAAAQRDADAADGDAGGATDSAATTAADTAADKAADKAEADVDDAPGDVVASDASVSSADVPDEGTDAPEDAASPQPPTVAPPAAADDVASTKD